MTYAYGGNLLVPPPSRWCQMQKPNRLAGVVVLVVDGVGLTEFVDLEVEFGRCMGVSLFMICTLGALSCVLNF